MNIADNLDMMIILPEIILTLGAMMVLVLDVFGSIENKRSLAWFSILSLVLCGATIWMTRGTTGTAFWGMLSIDSWSALYKLIFLVVTGLTILISVRYIERQNMNFGEYYFVLLISTVGMMFMVSSSNLLMILVGLEILSISTYILCAMQRQKLKSIESGMKYFLLGAMATAFLLYGIAMIYGSTGSVDLHKIARSIGNGKASEGMALFGLVLILCGFAFKVALVPFHMWTPDVYEGAPTPVTSFMSAGPKAAGFAALSKILLVGFTAAGYETSTILSILAVLTMTVGNLMALNQTNVKRMLAYSSISHAGYLVVALLASAHGGAGAMVFYLLGYTLMNSGVFGVIILLGGEKEKTEFSDFSGLGFKYPFLSVCLLIFMLSMAGIPLTVGFTGKFFIFQSAVETGYTWLAIVAFLNSVVSVYYYLKLVVYLYMKPIAENEAPIETPPFALQLGVVFSLLGVLYLGIFPGWLLDVSSNMTEPLLAMLK